MTTNFIGLVRKFIIDNKARVFFSILGIILSTALMISISNLINEMGISYQNDIKALYGSMDIMIGVNDISKDFMDGKKVERIIGTRGIIDSSKVLLSRNISISKHGKYMNSVYTIGTDNSMLAKSRYKYTEDLHEGEIIINKGMASDLKISVSDNVELWIKGNQKKYFKVIGIVDDINGAVKINEIMINVKALQNFLGLNDSYSLLLLKKDESVDIKDAANELRSIDQKLRVDIINEDENIKRNFQQIKVLGYGLGILTVLVSALFVFSNFRLFIYEYQREIAIMRAVGGKPSQSFLLIFFQSLIFIFTGGICGLFIAYFLNYIISSTLISILGISMKSIAFNWIIALKILLINFAILLVILTIPAFKSMRILPVEAMRTNEKMDFKESKWRKWAGIIIILFGVILIINGKITQKGAGDEGAVGGILGGLFIVLGLFVAVAYVIKPLLRILSPVFEFFGGRISYVAVKNILSQTKQNSLIILTLAGAITIAVSGVSLLETIKGNTQRQIKNEYICDYVLSMSNKGETQFKYDIVNNINNIKGVNTIIPYSKGEGGTINKINDTELSKTEQCSFIFVGINNLSKIDFLPKFKDVKNSLFTTKEYAKGLNLKDGDTINIVKNEYGYTGNGVLLKVTIIDKLPGLNLSNAALVDWSNSELQSMATSLNKILFNTDKTQNSEVLSGLNKLKMDYTGLKWSTLQEASLQANQMLNQRYALLIIAVIIILFIGVAGISITLNAHIQSHRKEYIILRAITLSPRQLFKMIITQSTLYCMTGTLTGIFTGIIMLMSLSIGMGEIAYVNYRLILYIVIGINILGIIFSVPMARRICNRSITEELISAAG